MSNRSIPRKPSVKAKPLNLQSPTLGRSDEDWLGENLLGDGDDVSSPTWRSTDFPQQPDSPDQGPYDSHDQGPEESHEFDDSYDQRPSDSHDQRPFRLIVAIDYGTTFTGVAYATPKLDDASFSKISIVQDWGPGMGNSDKIPSVYSYSPASSAREQQWGASISPGAITMVNTKLELDIEDNKLDELELILQLLHGTKNLGFEHVKASKGYPAYTWKTPEDIVTDYLTKVFEYLNRTVLRYSSTLREQMPVDIVITVPVNWSYRAKNSTFRAIKQAGFNEDTFPNLKDIIMVSEPEAAAIYTARYLSRDKKTRFLKTGDYFVLCDAGGGTVDVVSYKVTQLEPSLELEKMTNATSAKCGSAYIDANFKKWLRKILGDRYSKLDPGSAGQKISAHATEGEQMRKVMKKFDERKKKFSRNDARDIPLDLPKPLENLNIPGKVLGGQLTITAEEMKSFFNPCVDGVVELIQGQIQQVEKRRNRVKNVFLVGGFGESLYLQEELKESLDLRRITMQRPDTSWTAVVRGAVIYGIEKASYSNVAFTATCPKSYGIVLNEGYSEYKYDQRDRYTDSVTNNIMAYQQLTWLIRRGDLLLSDAERETEKEFMFAFQKTEDLKFKLPIYEYLYDDLPDRFETAQEELTEVAVLNPDLSTIPITSFDQFENPKTKQPYYVTYLICKMLLSGTSLEVGIYWGEKRVCNTKIDDIR